MLGCRAAGTPSPEVKWSKDGTTLQSKSRFVIVQSGTLKIDGEIFFIFVHFMKIPYEGRRNDLSFFSR